VVVPATPHPSPNVFNLIMTRRSLYGFAPAQCRHGSFMSQRDKPYRRAAPNQAQCSM